MFTELLNAFNYNDANGMIAYYYYYYYYYCYICRFQCRCPHRYFGGSLQSLLVHKLNYMKQESNKNTSNTN